MLMVVITRLYCRAAHLKRCFCGTYPPPMNIFTSTIILCLVVLSSAATNTLDNTIGLSSIKPPLKNATALNVVDPRFTTSFKAFGPPFDKNQSLMNVVNTMTVLALLDFEQEVGPSKFISAKWPDVVITTEGETQEDSVEARFLLWGLFLGIQSIILRSSVYNHWSTMIITLRWKKEVVGYITLSKAQPGLSLPAGNQTTSLEQGSDTNLNSVRSLNDTSINTSNTLNTSRLTNALN